METRNIFHVVRRILNNFIYSSIRGEKQGTSHNYERAHQLQRRPANILYIRQSVLQAIIIRQ